MPGKRSTTVNGAILFIRILSKLSTHRKMTHKDILESLRADGEEIELRTVQRALKDIIDCGQFPVECDDSSMPYGYKLRNTAPGFRVGELSPHEALLLQLAKEQLRYQLPSRLLNSMMGLFEDATYYLRAHYNRPETEWLKKVRVVSATQPLIPPSISKEVFDTISEALYNNRMLEVWYRNKAKEKKHKIVKPVALVQQGVRLYLVCQFEGYDNYRHLALHRINKTELRMDTFEYPKDFNLAEYDKDGHFGFGDGQRVRITLKVLPDLAEDLDETPLSKDQKITMEDGLAVVTATVIDTQMLKWWIKSYDEKIVEYRLDPLS